MKGYGAFSRREFGREDCAYYGEQADNHSGEEPVELVCSMSILSSSRSERRSLSICACVIYCTVASPLDIRL